MKILDILKARKLGYQTLHNTTDMLLAKKVSGGSYVDVTVSGNPIAITRAKGGLAKALTVDMLPIQDLNGYDSPWVGGGGKNKFDIKTFVNKAPSKQRCTASLSGETLTVTSTAIGSVWVGYAIAIGGTFPSDGFVISAVQGETFVSSGCDSTEFYELDEDNIILTSSLKGNGTPYTIANANCKKLAIAKLTFGGAESIGQTWTIKQQIEKANSATTWTPYSNICPISGRTSLDVTVNGETETLNFGQTVYGGTCDVVNGGTSVNYGVVDLGTLDWQIDISVPRFLTYSLQNVAKTPASNSQPANIKAPIYETLPLGSIYATGIDSVCALSTGGVVSIVDRRFTTVADFKTAMSGVMFCYEKETPTTLTTPATTISLNKGNNTLSTSGDNMSVTYEGKPIPQTLSMMSPNLTSTPEQVEEPEELNKEEENNYGF